MSPHVATLVIVAAGIALMLFRPHKIPEVYWVCGAAGLLVALRLVPPEAAGKAVLEGGDVYLFLIGMMLLSALARDHGVFDWLASTAVRRANGSSARLFTLVYGIGTLVTIFMSNDATAVVLTPAILAAVNKSKVKPLPHLFVCALVANAASFVLPISNPANLVLFRHGMPSLGSWLVSFGVPSILSIVATYAVMRWWFRADLRCELETDVAVVPLTLDGKLVLGGLGFVVAVLITASTFEQDLGLPACLAALLITGILCAKSKKSPLKLARTISWSTLVLVAGLFVLVDAVEATGALQATRRGLEAAQALPPGWAAFLVGGSVGVANNLVNNLPLALIAGGTLQAAHATGLIANATLIGVDLGPNLSVTGSLATILWLLALRKEKLDVSFWDFLKVGAIAMPVALALSLAGAVAMAVITGTR